MKVLVIGSGGREHALVWKISQSSQVDTIFCAPGNAGIQNLAECIDISGTDIVQLLNFAKNNKIDLTVVGPEIPLWHGIVDQFEQEGLKIFGPSASGTRLEGSKAFSKNFMKNKGIPTANFEIFKNLQNAKAYIYSQKAPIVVKADGLAAGKGAVVCRSRKEAQIALEEMMIKRIFGEAGKQVIVEECLTGQEVSVLAFSDGEHVVPLIPAQDHKAVYDDDLGPNTGGMGSYAPVPFIDQTLQERIYEEILAPTIKGLKQDGIKYKGILYAGLMISNGEPKVIEFNARFGDPETQSILPLLDFDLFDVLMAVAEESLPTQPLPIKNKFSTCVVVASGGYPGHYEKEKVIEGLDTDFGDDVMVFHAGTKMKDGRIVTNGGRVLGVTACGDNLKKSIDSAYKAVKQIYFDGAFYRKDIGRKGLK